MATTALYSGVGLTLLDIDDIRKGLDFIKECGYGYVCTNLFTDGRVKEQLKGFMDVKKAFSWSDMALPASEWKKRVMGLISNVEEEFHGSRRIRKNASEILQQQLSFCYHLGLKVAVIELRTNKESAHFASHVNTYMGMHSEYFRFQFWMKVAITARENDNSEDPWNRWNNVRMMCRSTEVLLNVALELTVVLPDKEEINRWLGEPVKALFISTDVFKIGNDGKAAVGKEHEAIIRDFLEMKAHIIVEAKVWSAELDLYQECIHNIIKLPEELQDDDERELKLKESSSNFLQRVPVPRSLRRTNSVDFYHSNMEGNQVKNYLYQEAITSAFQDKILLTSSAGDSVGTLVVLVIGAGRGPLVQICLDAADVTGVDVKVYAVEKNELTSSTLYDLQNKDLKWKDKVVVIDRDNLLCLLPTQKIDILVSDQLGTFEENEGAIEGLATAQKLLKDDGIVIPKAVTYSIAPVMATQLYFSIGKKHNTDDEPFDHIHITKGNNMYDIAEPRKLFQYQYPNSDEGRSRCREGSCKFTSYQDSVLHGFIGYFEAELYKDVILSNHPLTMSPGFRVNRDSFPVFFPIQEPVQIQKSAEIQAHFWRRASLSSIWYEWTITTPIAQPIHNSNGHYSKIAV